MTDGEPPIGVGEEVAVTAAAAQTGVPEAKESKHPLAIRLRGIRERADRIAKGVGTLARPETAPEQQSAAELQLLDPTLSELGALVTSYEQFLTEVLGDTQLREGFHPAYVRSIILPRVERGFDRTRHIPGAKESFDNDTKYALEHSDNNSQLRTDIWYTVKKLGDYDYFDSVEYQNFPDSKLSGESPDEAAIEQFVKQLAFEDIRAIQDAIGKIFSEPLPVVIRKKILEKVLPEGKQARPPRSKKPFRDDLYDEINKEEGSGERSLLVEYVPWLHVFKGSPLEAVFGQEELAAQSQKVYRDILNRSMQDSKVIELLSYFPTPEVMSYLLVFAAGRYDREYDEASKYVSRAQDVLDLFAKRDDWDSLVTGFQETYHSLEENVGNWFPGTFGDEERGNRLRAFGDEFFKEFIARNKDVSREDPRYAFLQHMVERARANLKFSGSSGWDTI